MTIGATVRASAGTSCPSCGGNVDVASRHVAVAGASIRIYCSEACLVARNAPPVPATQPVEPPRRRRIWWIAGGVVAGTTSLVLVYGLSDDAAIEPGPTPLSIVEQATRPPLPPPEPPAAAAVPPEIEPDADAAVVAELAHDAWIHPLAGPGRRGGRPGVVLDFIPLGPLRHRLVLNRIGDPV